MTETTVSKAPSWFKPVAIIAVLWNLIGLMAFVGDIMMTPEQLAEFEEPLQELYKTRPSWALAAFAVAVIAGTIGSILLLLKKRTALPVLIVSLLGVIVQNIYNVQSGAFQIQGTVAIIMASLIFVIAVLLILLARKGISQLWI